ncbi:MAG: hypothetical protein R2718_13290 [Solirubrobacterales bacterium]|nr:hypothetical protein [Solirubrobacterales bacterium]
MEASPRQHFEGPGQLPLEDDSGSVRAIGDRIVIDGLTVADERAAKVVRERAEAGSPPAETVTKAIEIGTRVIDTEGTATNVDYVQRVFEERVGKLHEDLSETLESGSAEIAQHIAENFDTDRADSVQGEIKQMLVTAIQHQQQELQKMLTTEDASNPLVAVQLRSAKLMLEAEERHRKELATLRESTSKENRALHAQVRELTERVSVQLERSEGDQRVAEAEEAGTRKGFTFEEGVFEAVSEIAAARGDCATHTGAESAEGGGKKGDVLVELGAADGPALGRVVFEVKDKKLSKNVAWQELNEAMAARAASYGVLVVAGEERVPAGREQLREYEGNKLIVAVDRDEPGALPLAVAYRLAAARVSMARDRELTVDGAEVRAVAEEATSCLRQAQAIRSTLTSIKTSSDKAKSGLNEMVDAVGAKLERIDALVAEADAGSRVEDRRSAGQGSPG